jgi:hypothetical protein
MTPARPAGTLAVVVLMTGAVPEGVSVEGLASLEVRWILPGQLDTAVAGWFPGSQPESESESREDAYLLDPGLGGLSGEQARCAVELTEVRFRQQDWWSLGLEATGPAESLRHGLEATAALVFTQALPGRADLRIDESRSYADWLRTR